MQPPQPQAEPASRRASSTCSTSTSPRRSGGVGCMAGLLRLISPYHRSHHRRRLTAKNAAARDSQAPPAPSSSPPRKKKAAAAQQPPASPAPSPPVKVQQLMVTAAVRRRRSCDAPRSPTIAPEHRRSSCDSPRPPPPAIIARLMGLEESAPPSPSPAAATAAATATPRPVVLPTRPPPPPPAPAPAPPETAAEKRRKLLGALEKCDEDLKTLRRIIAAVRAAEMRAASASDVCPAAATTTTTTPAAAGKGAKRTFGRVDQLSPSPSPSPSPPTQKQQQYPSPDSVLDAISSPRFPCRKRPSPCADHDMGGKGGCGNNGALAPTVGSKTVKPSRTLGVFSGDYCKINSGGGELPLHAVHCPVPSRVVGMPRSAGAESWRRHRRRWEQEAAAAGRVISRATAESVGEATMWVTRRQQGGAGEGEEERGRVVAALERAIVQDLVGDLVAELQAQAGPGEHGAGGGCRKRLCF